MDTVSSAFNTDSIEERGAITEREVILNNYNVGKVSSSLLPEVKSVRKIFPAIENKTFDDDEIQY